MVELAHIERLDQAEVLHEEKKCKADYKKKQMVDRLDAEREQNDRKKAELQARGKAVVSKVGKPTMPRSTKKGVKKEVVEFKIDEKRLEYIRYLGEDFINQLTADSGTNN